MVDSAMADRRARRYRVANKRVIHQVVDGEALVINLESGHYYALNNTATCLWNLVTSGGTVDQIANAVKSSYAASPPDTVDFVIQFLARLEAERLIQPEEPASPTAAAPPAALPLDETARPAFRPPDFERYSDMEDLLLADPIHEVDFSEPGSGRSQN